jgi:hypothetical protein
VSPTSLHPPLRLTLTAPEEPGFLLERVQVRNMHEVWAVLEVVRDQCWLNEILNGIAWMPEAIAGPTIDEDAGAEATEEELRALLSGQALSPACHAYLTLHQAHTHHGQYQSTFTSSPPQ